MLYEQSTCAAIGSYRMIFQAMGMRLRQTAAILSSQSKALLYSHTSQSLFHVNWRSNLEMKNASLPRCKTHAGWGLLGTLPLGETWHVSCSVLEIVVAASSVRFVVSTGIRADAMLLSSSSRLIRSEKPPHPQILESNLSIISPSRGFAMWSGRPSSLLAAFEQANF